MKPERRAQPRRAADLASPLQLLGADGGLLGMAVLEDVSAAGARLLASRVQAAGATLVLSPQAPHRLAGQRFPLVVSRCEPLGGGYRLAGSFLQPLRTADVDGLAGPC